MASPDMDPSSAALHLKANKYFQVAAFVMLAYDHILTLGQEVERIWMRRISFAAILFLLNRYVTLIQFIIIVVAFNDPGWKGASCTRYVLFEGTSTVALIAVGQMIMILRVVALYNRSKKIFGCLLFLWTGQIIISFVGLRKGFALPLPPGLVGCLLASSDSLLPSLWIAPLFTDSFIFLLTIYRTRYNIGDLVALSIRGKIFAADRVITVLLRDGVIYYFLIFLVNLMNALIFFLARPDIKEIGASFSQLLTCTVISRLVLNLRSLSGNTTADRTMSLHAESLCFQLSTTVPKQPDTIWTRTLDDFTPNNLFTFGSAQAPSPAVPLQQVEVTHHGSDHPHHEV